MRDVALLSFEVVLELDLVAVVYVYLTSFLLLASTPVHHRVIHSHLTAQDKCLRMGLFDFL